VAAGDSQVYGKFTELQMSGATKVDDGDDLYVTLHTSSYTPDIDAHDFADDLTNELANGDGYTTGGAALASKTVTYDAANNRTELDCADLVWNFTATKAPKWAVLQKTTGSAATSPLIAYWDLGTVSTDTTFTLQINAEGILQFRATAQTA
jgi:hypothetical protein